MAGFERTRGAAPRLIGLSLAVCLVAGVAACAPEPGEAAGHTDKDRDTVNPETEWGGGDQPDPHYEPNATLPESFPASFELPADVRVHDTGERSPGQWFLVLEAGDQAAADSLWLAVVEVNRFDVIDETKTAEGSRSATLDNGVLEVVAVTIPQVDGTVWLSYDITQLG